MATWPCTNPACKSHGIPHPNCRCPAPMAEGGEVDFCAHGMPHQPECEYYAHGGSVEPKLMHHLGDKSEAVANALYHSGALQLLRGNLHGAYADRPNDLANIFSYARNVRNGSKAIDSAINGVFDQGPVDHYNTKEDREKLHEFIEKGVLNQQMNNQPLMMAHGGLVKTEDKSILSGTGPMQEHLPEHNVMLQSAKTRVNNYLNTLRPVKNISKLAFDDDTEDPTKKRDYHKALDLAIKPGNIFKNIKHGSLAPDDVVHLKNLYPEVYDHLSKKLTERVIKSQLDEKKPAYKVRQALSLFLGAHLDSSMNPETIQAAQATFMRQAAQKQAAQPQQKEKAKKGTSSLGKVSNQYLTNEQASLKREQKIS